MRDVFIDEVELEESMMEDYLRRKIRGSDVTLERVDMEDGTVIFNINASGVMQRFSFTEI